MTPQEVFTKAKNHLLSQNTKSRIDGDCAYRGLDNLQCAVGCFIPDELYTPKMEKKSVGTLIVWLKEQGDDKYKDLLSLLITYHNLFMDLQIVHDSYQPKEWVNRLRRVSEQYYLEY